MRVSLGLPTHRVDLADELLSAPAIAEVSRAAEVAGFDAVFVTDHPAPPASWLRTGGHHTLDPMVALSIVAAATSTLRLQTNLYVAAYRNPFLAAKAVASLDAVSGGRVILGVGAGYLEGEFAALGVDFATRNDRLDEVIRVMRAAWTGEPVSLDGEGFSADGVVCLPRPAQVPGPPVWVGGNSRRAIRRAIDLGDGWVPMPSPARASAVLHTPGMESLADLASGLAYAREYADSVGRPGLSDVAFMPAGLDGFSRSRPSAQEVLESLAQMAEVGVTYATVSLVAESRTDLLAAIEAFGSEVLAQRPTR